MKHHATIFVALMVAPACSGPTQPSCDICTTSALVYGTVVDASGEPVVGAPIDVRVYRDTCEPGALRGGSDVDVPRTNSSGAYRARVISLFQPFTASCFVITVNQNADPQWPMGSTQRSGQLAFRSDLGQEPRDSIRFDLQF